MNNVRKGQDRNSGGQQDDRSDNKSERGILSLGHAFFNRYTSDKNKENEQKSTDGKWVKAGAAAAILYTAITLVILGVNAYQASVSRDTERRQLRAYIGVSPGDVTGFGTPKQRLRIVRKNYGSTPAYDVGFSNIGFAIIAPGGPIPFREGCNFHKGPLSLLTMFPSAELRYDLNLDIQLQPNDINDVNSGNKYLVYFGNVCYRDAFDRVHYTNYCWMHRGASLAAADAEACLTYNDAD